MGQVTQNVLLDNTHYVLRSAVIESTLGQLRLQLVRRRHHGGGRCRRLSPAVVAASFGFPRFSCLFRRAGYTFALRYKPDWKYGLTFHFGHYSQRSDTFAGDLAASQRPGSPVHTHDERYLSIPDWFVVLLTAGGSAPSAPRFDSSPPIRAGFCGVCGYDLRQQRSLLRMRDRDPKSGGGSIAPAARVLIPRLPALLRLGRIRIIRRRHRRCTARRDGLRGQGPAPEAGASPGPRRACGGWLLDLPPVRAAVSLEPPRLGIGGVAAGSSTGAGVGTGGVVAAPRVRRVAAGSSTGGVGGRGLP